MSRKVDKTKNSVRLITPIKLIAMGALPASVFALVATASLLLFVGSAAAQDSGDAPAVSWAAKLYEVNEPDKGEVAVVELTVLLSHPVDEAVTVTYRTASARKHRPATAAWWEATARSDYTPIEDGQAVIAAGATEATIEVTVLGDDAPGIPGMHERFPVRLVSVSGGDAELSGPLFAWVEIRDNDVTWSGLNMLSGLTISPGTLAETFASTTTRYTASVANTVEQMTVTPTTTDSAATVKFLDEDNIVLPDAASSDHGHQVDLAMGFTLIKIWVRVPSQGGTIGQVYWLEVTRSWQVASAQTQEGGQTSPGGLTATATENGVVLKWNPGDHSAMASQVIRRRTVGGAGWSDLAQVGRDVAAWTDATVAAGVSYRYLVKGVDEAGAGICEGTSDEECSDRSNVVEIAPGAVATS